MPELVIKLDGVEIDRKFFDKPEITIGRDRENDVMLEDLNVSRRHARIDRVEGGYVVTDLDSSNGTFVNGVRFSETQVFHHDSIFVGKHTILFLLSEREAAETTSPDMSTQTVVMTASPALARLVVFQPKTRPVTVVLERDGEVRIGRAHDNRIRLHDWFVDLHQASVEMRDGDAVLLEKAQTNPTLVDAVPAGPETTLREGSVLQVGMTQMLFTAREVADSELEHMRLPPPVALGAAPERPEPPEVSAPVEELRETPAGESLEAPEPLETDTPPGFEDEEDFADLNLEEAVEFGPEELDLEELQPEMSFEAETPRQEPEDEELWAQEAVEEGVYGAPDAEEAGTAEEAFGMRDEEDRPIAEAQPVEEPVGAPIDEAGGEPPAREAVEPEGADPKVVARLEAALQNRSAAVRKQAAAQLKKLTGRDYDAG